MKMANGKWQMANQQGQALVTLLIFSATAIIITSGAVVATIANSQTTSTFGISQEVYQLAEAGTEDAILQLLRNPSYTISNNVLTFGTGTATVTVAGTNPKTVTVVGESAGIKRTIVVVATFTGAQLTVNSWTET